MLISPRKPVVGRAPISTPIHLTDPASAINVLQSIAVVFLCLDQAEKIIVDKELACIWIVFAQPEASFPKLSENAPLFASKYFLKTKQIVGRVSLTNFSHGNRGPENILSVAVR